MSVRLLLIFFVFYLFKSTCAYSQEIVGGGMCEGGNKGAFEVKPSYVGCGNLKVDFESTLSGAGNVRYLPEYDRSSNISTFLPGTSAIYSSPGTYTILQIGSVGSSGFSLCKQVHVLENRKVNASLEISCGKYAIVKLADDDITRAYDFIEINWGSSFGIQSVRKGDGLAVNKAYSTAIPNITVQGKYNNNISCAGEVTTLNPTTSENSVEAIQIKRVEMLEDGKIAMLYNGLDKVSTEIFYSEVSGAYLTTNNINDLAQPGNIIIDKNLDAEKEYKLKLVSQDCGSAKDSREVKTMVLEVTPLDGEISLKWNRYIDDNDFVGYQLFRDGNPIQSFTSIDDLTFTDKDLDCNTTYTYQIVASTSQVNSFSAPKSEKTTTSAPDKIIGASVSVKDNNVIEADVVLGEKGLTTTYNLLVERAEQGSSAFKQVSGAKNQDLHFEDNAVNTVTTSYCYRFSYENSCPLQSEFTEPVCTILLRQTTTELTWNNAIPFIEGLNSYDVIQSESNSSTPVGFNTTFALDPANLTKGDYSYQIRGRSRNGSFLSFSNVVKYQQNASLLIPDAFTPNGDNINEKFEIKGLFINSFKISIFNRWGQVVFQSDDILESWDGTIEGVQAPSGYYTFKTEFKDVTDNSIAKEGTLFLIR